MILVIAEQREGTLNRATWEVIAAAQQIDGPIKVAVAGANVDTVTTELSAADVDEVLIVAHPALERYTPDGFVQALEQVIQQEQPALVLCPHTYQTRDFAPKLAARLDRTILTDCVGIKRLGAQIAFVRPMFQGKLHADVAASGAAPHFVTFQIGAFRQDSATRRDTPAPTRTVSLSIDVATIRQQPEAPFKEAKQAIDLTQAERIVGGRTRHQGRGASRAGAAVGQGVECRGGRVAPDLRCRLAPDGSSDWQLRADGGAEALPGPRHLPARSSIWWG